MRWTMQRWARLRFYKFTQELYSLFYKGVMNASKHIVLDSMARMVPMRLRHGCKAKLKHEEDEHWSPGLALW